MTSRDRSRLGELLLTAGAVTEADLKRALAEQSQWGGRLGQALLAIGALDELALTAALARQLGLPLLDLDGLDVGGMAPGRIPVGVAERYGLVPVSTLESPSRLLLACFDPTHAEALDVARRAAGLPCELALATPVAIQRTIRRLYYGETAPAATPGGPAFNVTRHSMEPASAAAPAADVETRLAALEARLAAIEARLEAVPARRSAEKT